MADEIDPMFTDGETAEVAEPSQVTEQVAEPQPDPTPEPEPNPEAAPQPQPQQRQDSGFVPIAAMMDERDKRRALEQEVAQLRQAQPQPRTAPDPFDDPHGFAEHQNTMVEQRLAQERFAMSDMFARQQHGAETVDKAVEWAQQRAQQDPTFAASYMRQANPIDWIVQQHKRDDMLGQIGDRSMDDFVRDYMAKNPDKFPAPAVAAPAVVTQQAIPPAKPPRSLATQGSGPSDVRDVATGDLAAVDAVFPK